MTKSPAVSELRMKLAHAFLPVITIPNMSMSMSMNIDTTVNKGIGGQGGVDMCNDYKTCESKTNERTHERGRGRASEN